MLVRIRKRDNPSTSLVGIQRKWWVQNLKFRVLGLVRGLGRFRRRHSKFWDCWGQNAEVMSEVINYKIIEIHSLVRSSMGKSKTKNRKTWERDKSPRIWKEALGTLSWPEIPHLLRHQDIIFTEVLPLLLLACLNCSSYQAWWCPISSCLTLLSVIL